MFPAEVWKLKNEDKNLHMNGSTVGPRTERPQAERVSQLNDFQLGPKRF